MYFLLNVRIGIMKCCHAIKNCVIITSNGKIWNKSCHGKSWRRGKQNSNLNILKKSWKSTRISPLIIENHA